MLAGRAGSGAVPLCHALQPEDATELDRGHALYAAIGDDVAAGELKRAVALLFGAVRQANRYVDTAAPWRWLHTDPRRAETTLYVCVQIVANLAQLARPFLPFSADTVLAWLGVKRPAWRWIEVPPGRNLPPPRPLIRRLDPEVAAAERQRLEQG